MKTNYVSAVLVFCILAFLGCEKERNEAGQSVVSTDTPRPTPQQIDYQRKEKVAFVHFGVNTFTNREWGTGQEEPEIFNPTDFDANQWAKTLSKNGFKTLILTAKHHDGFCLWPSEYTDHDISSSPYKNGTGDIVKEVSEAATRYGIDFGVYLSPWDMHEESYGTPEYNTYYLNQLRELLTNYGDIAEVWFDGAKGEGAKDMDYDFEGWWATVRELQPDALIFSDQGPDIRWIGNEHGFAGETNWSTVNRDSITIGKPGQEPYLNSGEAGGPDWIVGECDVSIRPGWFYHPEEDDEVKTVEELVEIYLKSVGRNCTLLLNIPPDTTGQFHPTDTARLNAFSDTLATMFDDNLATDATIEASSSETPNMGEEVLDGQWDTYWIAAEDDTNPVLTLRYDAPISFHLLSVQENIPLGQRISKFEVSIYTDNDWQIIADETTVGYKRILPLGEVATDAVRIRFLEFSGPPAINEIGLYRTHD